MPRTNTVTLTAAAVTLVCVSASIYASPQVLAESMGRQTQTFAPLDPTDTNDRQQSAVPRDTTVADASTGAPASDAPDTADAGDWNVAGAESTSSVIPDDVEVTAPQIELQAGTPTAEDTTPEDTTVDTSDEATSRIVSEIPQVEVSVPSPEASQDRQVDEIEVDQAEDEQTEDDEVEVPDDVESPDSVTVVVNKHHGLPSDYVPADLVDLPDELSAESHELREVAATAAQELFEAAADEGIDLSLVSAYRSYDYQEQLYNNYVSQHGSAVTNEMSARPGHSEHQTGLALDVDTPDGRHTLLRSFGETEAGQWLAEHAAEYGFVIRYPEGAEEVTGFQYEPWHLRYLGDPFAQQVADNSGIVEKEFELEPAPDYED